MTRPPIKTIRRLALVAAVVVVLILAGTYGLRRWRAHRARQDVPAAIPGDVQQQAETFTFTRSEGGQTLFTVEASRTIERTGKTTILEDVVAVIHGRRGERADEIRSGRCEYDVGDTGQVHCPGEVTITLGGETGGAPASPDRSLRLMTTGMRFDPGTRVAWTEAPVRFIFSGGAGEAVGLRYQPGEPIARLHRQVRLRLSRGGKAPVDVQGAALHYHSRSQTLTLLSPLSVEMENRRLTAHRVQMEMDENFRTKRLVAFGNARVQIREGAREHSLRAPRVVALYAPDGRLQQVKTIGPTTVVRQRPDSQESLTCEEAVVWFSKSDGRMERVRARGKVELITRSPDETRELRAPMLELTLPWGGNRQLLVARQRGTLVLKPADGAERILTADRIQLEFRDEKRLDRLAASGQVETQVLRANGQRQKTWSEELRASFDEAGELAEAEQWGRFRYDGGDNRAEAGRAKYRRANETVVLTESPAAWDATTRTTARVIQIAETAGIFSAEGEVRTTLQPGQRRNSGFGTGQPMIVSADRLRADRERGWARYEGNARMWEGENRLAATAIELFQSPGKLVAEGGVEGFFVEAPVEGARRRAVTVTSRRFTYVEAEHRGMFEEDVTARNDFGTLTAPRLEVFLTAGQGQGSQRLERAHARGGVRIQQPGRQAASEEADYRAAAEAVVLTGGNPTITDGQGSSVTGAKLTLFLADGSILVQSAEGERTVTRRPWTR